MATGRCKIQDVPKISPISNGELYFASDSSYGKSDSGRMKPNSTMAKAIAVAFTCSLRPTGHQLPQRRPDAVDTSGQPLAKECHKSEKERHNWVQQLRNLAADIRINIGSSRCRGAQTGGKDDRANL
jgi:hypothetical protein